MVIFFESLLGLCAVACVAFAVYVIYRLITEDRR